MIGGRGSAESERIPRIRYRQRMSRKMSIHLRLLYFHPTAPTSRALAGRAQAPLEEQEVHLRELRKSRRDGGGRKPKGSAAAMERREEREGGERGEGGKRGEGGTAK